MQVCERIDCTILKEGEGRASSEYIFLN